MFDFLFWPSVRVSCPWNKSTLEAEFFSFKVFHGFSIERQGMVGITVRQNLKFNCRTSIHAKSAIINVRSWASRSVKKERTPTP